MSKRSANRPRSPMLRDLSQSVLLFAVRCDVLDDQSIPSSVEKLTEDHFPPSGRDGYSTERLIEALVEDSASPLRRDSGDIKLTDPKRVQPYIELLESNRTDPIEQTN